jgi:hypothetical protein
LSKASIKTSDKITANNPKDLAEKKKPSKIEDYFNKSKIRNEAKSSKPNIPVVDLEPETPKISTNYAFDLNQEVLNEIFGDDDDENVVAEAATKMDLDVFPDLDIDTSKPIKAVEFQSNKTPKSPKFTEIRFDQIYEPSVIKQNEVEKVSEPVKNASQPICSKQRGFYLSGLYSSSNKKFF